MVNTRLDSTLVSRVPTAVNTDQLVAGLDIGSAKTTAVIAEVVGDLPKHPTLNILGRDKWASPTIVGLSNNDPLQFSQDLDIPFRQGSFQLGVPTFGNPQAEAGIQFGMAILSDLEAFLFVRAAQGDRRSNIMFAPKLTLFNGVPGFVQSALQQPFVVSVTPVVGTAKNVVEIFTGDLIPDKSDRVHKRHKKTQNAEAI